MNREPLDENSKYIDIGLEKKWTDGTNTTPPSGASATFTVHQQKNTKIGGSSSTGEYTIKFVSTDGNDELASITANNGDQLVFQHTLKNDEYLQVGRKGMYNPDQFGYAGQIYKNGAQYGYYCYTVDKNHAQNNVITFNVYDQNNKSRIIGRSDFDDAPVWINNTSVEPTWTGYTDTEWTKSVTLPTTAGAWSTTIKDLIQEDADGNRYRYYITEDSCTPVSKTVFKEDIGNGPEHTINTSGQKVEVTNTYENETTDFKFSKIWKNIRNQSTTWPTGATITVTMNAYTDTSQKAIDDVQVTLSADGSAAGVTPAWTATTSAEGTVTTFKVEGLQKYKDGKELHYYVIETQVDGYKAPSYATSEGHGLVFKDSDVPKATNGLQIINTPEGGYELPSTGGPGTLPLAGAGALLLLLAGTALTVRKLLIQRNTGKGGGSE